MIHVAEDGDRGTGDCASQRTSVTSWCLPCVRAEPKELLEICCVYLFNVGPSDKSVYKHREYYIYIIYIYIHT